MSRNYFDAAHIDCPETGQTVNFLVLIGSLTRCPECALILPPDESYENELILNKKGLKESA